MGRRYIGGSQARSSDVFNFLLPEEDINPSLIYNENYSDRLLRQEYTRLRDIAQKRIKRMIGKPEALETVNQLQGGFPTLKELKQAASTSEELREMIVYQLGRQKRFLTAKRGSLSGIRSVNKQISGTLKGRGIEVEPDELQNFGNFMQTMKRAYGIRGRTRGIVIDWSKIMADLWKNLNEKGNITEKDFREAVEAVIKENADGDEEIADRIRKALHGAYASDFFKDENLSSRTRRAKEKRNRRAKEKRSRK